MNFSNSLRHSDQSVVPNTRLASISVHFLMCRSVFSSISKEKALCLEVSVTVARVFVVIPSFARKTFCVGKRPMSDEIVDSPHTCPLRLEKAWAHILELRSSGWSPAGKGDEGSPVSSTDTFSRFDRGCMSSSLESEESQFARHVGIISSSAVESLPLDPCTVIQFCDEFCCTDSRLSPTTHFVRMGKSRSRRFFWRTNLNVWIWDELHKI